MAGRLRPAGVGMSGGRGMIQVPGRRIRGMWILDIDRYKLMCMAGMTFLALFALLMATGTVADPFQQPP